MNLPALTDLPTIAVTDIPVTALPFESQIGLMVDWAKRRSSRVVCVANVHMLMEARSNAMLRSVMRQAHLVTPDGMPLVWVMRAMGVKAQDRVAGLDIFLAACQKASEQDIAVYLLGSTQKILDKIKDRLQQDYPNLKLAGMESLPFRPLTEAETIAVVDRVNSSGAGLTFVSLGCPKQECWMGRQYGKIQSVMVGVGGVFPVYAGLHKHAPQWMREAGLEWFYRLLQEPRRLFGRYLKTIPPFIWLALRQLIRQNRGNAIKSNLVSVTVKK